MKCTDKQLEYSRKFQKAHRELCRERVRACYWKKRDEYLARVRKQKKQYVLDRRCTSCSAPLVQGENKTCVNCGNTMKGEFKYAKDIKANSLAII